MELEQRKRASWRRKLMFILNIIAIVFLLFSYGASFISPEKIWWLALFGIGYGIALLVNIFFVLFWIVIKSRRFLFSLLVILIGFGKIFNIYEINFFSGKKIQQKESLSFPVKIMSYNVRLFDLYNWSGGAKTKTKILNFLSKESPDIVCFQEYFTSERKENKITNTEALRKAIPAEYTNVAYSSTENLDHWGIATFSKFPIVHKEIVHFQEHGGNIFTYSDIKIGNDTIRVYNAHLESIRFGKDDYKFIENLGGPAEQDELKGSVNIILRLKRAFIKRAKQTDVLHEHILKSPYPVVVCGDFNDTPSSYTYSVLCRDLEDSFRESGSGFGKTYVGAFPSFRIDYILHDEKLKSTGYLTYREKLSDHFPISCWIERR